MVKPVQFAHVVYNTRRFDEMISWYRSVFEAEIVYQDTALAFLTYDEEHHRFAFVNLDVLAPAGKSLSQSTPRSVNHVAFTYRTVGELLETYATLKTSGIHPYWPVHHGTTLSLYYADPDGNRMEFEVDCGTVEEATGFMKSPAFAANPIGVLFDPDVLLVRCREGASEEELLVRADGPPSPIPPQHG